MYFTSDGVDGIWSSHNTDFVLSALKVRSGSFDWQCLRGDCSGGSGGDSEGSRFLFPFWLFLFSIIPLVWFGLIWFGLSSFLASFFSNVFSHNKVFAAQSEVSSFISAFSKPEEARDRVEQRENSEMANFQMKIDRILDEIAGFSALPQPAADTDNRAKGGLKLEIVSG